jgi:hypothetical protein
MLQGTDVLLLCRRTALFVRSLASHARIARLRSCAAIFTTMSLNALRRLYHALVHPSVALMDRSAATCKPIHLPVRT